MTRPCMSAPLSMMVALLTLLPQALRAETEVYGGIGYGYSTYSIDAIRFEGSSGALRQYLGFNYGDYVGLELGYYDFGSINDQIVLNPGEASVRDTIETSGYDLSLVGRYPLNEELVAFGKIGAIRWDSTATLADYPIPSKIDGDDLIWGVGLEFRGAGRFHVRIAADFIDISFADAWWALNASVLYAIPVGR